MFSMLPSVCDARAGHLIERLRVGARRRSEGESSRADFQSSALPLRMANAAPSLFARFALSFPGALAFPPPPTFLSFLNGLRNSGTVCAGAPIQLSEGMEIPRRERSGSRTLVLARAECVRMQRYHSVVPTWCACRPTFLDPTA